MKSIHRVLITSVGGYLGKKNLEFLKKSYPRKIWILATDFYYVENINSLSDKFYRVPKGNSKKYFSTLFKIVKENNIKIIIPCSDEEALTLSLHSKEFEKINATVACQTYEVNRIITNKVLTYQTLKNNGMLYSEFEVVNSFKELLNQSNKFFSKYSEFVIKSPVARGNRGTLVISKFFKKCKNYESSRELHMSFKYFKANFKEIIEKNFPLIVCERLYAPSYDIDVLSNKGNMLYSVARERINPAGVPFKGNIIRNSNILQKLAKDACRAFNLSWLLDIDVMTNKNGKPVILEINPRASGSSAVSMFLGVPLYKNLIQLCCRIPISSFKQPVNGKKILSNSKNTLLTTYESKKIVCIIQARMSSTRLPGKSLALINKVPCIERVIKRVKKSKLIDDIWVACSNSKSDDILANFVKALNIKCYRGSMNDVLSRYVKVCELTNSDYIVRVTGDCPLIDPNIIDKVIRKILATGADFASNTIQRSFPDGLDVEVFTSNALMEANYNSKEKFLREHVTPYISGKLSKTFTSGEFYRVQVLNRKDYSDIRLTLDRKEDLKFLNQIYKSLNNSCTWREVINFLKKEKHLLNINKHIEYNEKTKDFYN